MTTGATRSFNGILSGAAINLIDVPSAKFDDAYSSLAAFVLVNQKHAQETKTDMGLQTISAGQAFVRGANTSGYYACLTWNSSMHADILLPDLGYGQLMALEVDLDKCPLYRGPGKVDAAAHEELHWAAFGADAPDPAEPPDSLLLGAPDPAADAKHWNARLTGAGSFVGIFELDRVPAGTTKMGNRGLIVAYGTMLSNQKANKLRISQSQTIPTYGEFATNEVQAKLRRKQMRNVAIVLHDAATALGCSTEVEMRRIEDREALPGPAERRAGASVRDPRREFLAAMRPKPMKVVPDIHNEMDFMHAKRGEQLDGTYAVPRVEYFSGVASVDSALGGMIAFENADPSLGLHLLRDVNSLKTKFWDGGYTGVPGWKYPDALAAASEFYKPLRVVKE